MQKNKVAAFLKAYAVVNAVCGVLLVLFVMIELDPFLSVLIFFGTALASGLIYAVGEIVDLLEEIRWNTRPKDPPAPEPEPQPKQRPAAPAQPETRRPAQQQADGQKQRISPAVERVKADARGKERSGLVSLSQRPAQGEDGSKEPKKCKRKNSHRTPPFPPAGFRQSAISNQTTNSLHSA